MMSALSFISTGPLPLLVPSSFPTALIQSTDVSSTTSGAGIWRRVSTGSKVSKINGLQTKLPLHFTPCAYSVVCGRGRKPTEAVGNRRLNVIAQLFVDQYSQAKRKDEKSVLVSQIVRIVEQACDDPTHAFIRYVDGQWYQVNTLNAREKVGTVLRDLLSSKYRSSTKSKLARRKQRQQEAKQPQFSHNSDYRQDTIVGDYVVPVMSYSSEEMIPTTFSNLDLTDLDLDVVVSDSESESVLSGEELEMDNLFNDTMP